MNISRNKKASRCKVWGFFICSALWYIYIYSYLSAKIVLFMKRKVVVIYHDADPDGLMSRAIVEGRIVAEMEFNKECQVEVVSIGYNYQKDEPTIKAILDAVNGAFVYMVDVTLPKSTLPELMKRCAHLVVIDHHEAALAEYLSTNKFHEFVVDADGIEFAKLLPKSEFILDSSDSHRGAFLAFIQQRDWFQKCFAVVHNYTKSSDNKAFLPVSLFDKGKTLTKNKVGNFSAAELCYMSLVGICTNYAVTLVGEYDTYRSKDKPEFWANEVLPFRFGCYLMDDRMYDEMLQTENPNYDVRFEKIMKAGRAAMKYQTAKDRLAMKNVRIAGLHDEWLSSFYKHKVIHTVALFNGDTSGRDFWASFDGEKVDMFMSYIIVGDRVRISMRKPSWSIINVGDIAKRIFDGGGHPAASGAETDIHSFFSMIVIL